MSIRTETERSGSKRQVIHVDSHVLHADSGGDPTAPTPHDLFDAALIACKALTAHIYASSRGIALDRVTAEVERDDAEERRGKYVLNVKLGFEGALSEAEKQKLHDIVTRCPIHKLMTTAEIEVRQAPYASEATQGTD